MEQVTDNGAGEATDLFGDVKAGNDLFGGLGSDSPDPGDHGTPGLKPAEDPISSLFGGSEENPGQPDGEDFFGQIQQQHKPDQQPPGQEADDLTARWQAALASDGFLADDSEGFLPSDDEGFLPDSNDETPVQDPSHGPSGTLGGSSTISTGSGVPQVPSAASRYTPQAQIPMRSPAQPQYGGTWPAQQPQQPPYNPYAPPQQAPQAPVSHIPGPPPTTPYASFGARPPPAPEAKAQSFVGRKEGYQSPYDLPPDIRPLAIRRGPSNLQQSQGTVLAGMGSIVSQAPPVRSSSMGAVFSIQSQQPQGPPKPKGVPQQKFFEELPIGPPRQRATSAFGRHPESMNRVPSGAGSYQAAPPRPESTQGFYRSPQKSFAQPVIGSPQQMSVQLAPQAAAAAASSVCAAPPAPAVGYQAPPNTTHPPASSAAPYASPVNAPPAGGMKYAPRPAGPPQVGNRIPSGGFVPPPQQAPEATFQPPPRAQTQSPGMVYGKANKTAQRPGDPYERPSSAFAHSNSASYASVDFHQRQQSLGLSFMAPNDETCQDVLQRWQGAPVFCWGFGGSIACTFPKRVQMYTSDMQQPVIKCSPGEVKIRSIKEFLPFEKPEGIFPGPAWSGSRSTNKAKKKELLTWFTDKIEDLERRAQGEGTRAEEKVLLWKVVRTLLENDGALEGNPEVQKAVRTILSPETMEEGMGDHGAFSAMGGLSSTAYGPNIERADLQAIKTIKNNLLKGDRAAAVWHAVDRKLWSHALLISGTVGRDLWKQVVQEFVKNEVKTLGEDADSLAALYETFAGNWEECVDKLVSASARMGMPMLGGASRSGGVNIDEKLDRWRETLGLILSNRSPGDAESILALGKLLVGYGRVEAGHIWYVIFL